MAENSAIVKRTSKTLGVSPDELVRKGIEEFFFRLSCEAALPKPTK